MFWSLAGELVVVSDIDLGPLDLIVGFRFSSAVRRWSGRDGLLVLIQRVGRDPARHHHHRHARAGVGGAAGKIQTLDLPTAIARLEGAEKRP